MPKQNSVCSASSEFLPGISEFDFINGTASILHKTITVEAFDVPMIPSEHLAAPFYIHAPIRSKKIVRRDVRRLVTTTGCEREVFLQMHFYLQRLSDVGSDFILNPRNYRGLLYGSLLFAIHRMGSVEKPTAVYAEAWGVDTTELKRIKKRTHYLLRTQSGVGLVGKGKKRYLTFIEEASDLFDSE